MGNVTQITPIIVTDDPQDAFWTPERGPLRVVTDTAYKAARKLQGTPAGHAAFRCPMCNTIQSAATFAKLDEFANARENIPKYVAFSCIGRFTGQGSPSKAQEGKGCDWTLGGLFALQKLSVRVPGDTPDKYVDMPYFELASPEDAQKLYEQNKEVVFDGWG